MLRFFGRSLSILTLLVLMGSACAWCQSPAQGTGRISGKVADDQGGAIPGATVQIVSKDGAVKREVKSDDSGTYTVADLPAGSYQVIVVYAGFENLTSPPIDVKPGASSTFDAAMVVAASKEVVNVNTAGAATTVELQTATLATTISQKEVTGLGLNGRNFSQLIGLSPGVSNQTGQDEAKVGVAGSAKYSVNGGRVEYNTFEVDGSDVLNTSINASRGQGEPLMVYPSIDAVQEIKVLTSNYSALYGKSASGSVLVTTKSGTEKFHGNAYYFIRNELFNARNYFDAPGRTPLYRRQDAGGTLGGPLFIPRLYEAGKTKTFFFFSEELRLEKTPTAYNQAVPTDSERDGVGNEGYGDFSDVCPGPVPGATPSLDLTKYPDCPHYGLDNSGQPIARPAISRGYLSSSILNTGLIPRANAVTGCNTTNPTGLPRCYIASISPSTYWREELFRIDHKLTDSQQLSFRYVHDSWHTTTLAPQWGVVQNSFPTVENSLVGPGLNMETSLAGSLPRGFVNRISFSYSVQHITLTPEDGPGLNTLQRPDVLNDPGSAAGFTPVPGNAYCGSATGATTTQTACAMGYIFNNGFNGNRTPGLSFTGSNGAYGGHGFNADTGFAPWQQANPTYALRDDASKSVGNHNLQFGFDATLVQQNEVSAVSGANSGATQGLLTFSNQQSRYTTGNAFADFLAGPSAASSGFTQAAIKSYTQDSGQAKYYNRYKAIDLYLQDDWKVSNRLSLNIGLRASLFGPWFNAKNTAYNWRPEAYNASLGQSIYVDPIFGYVARTLNASPVPLNLNSLDPAITNGLVQCGVNGVPKSCMNSGTFFPGPRAGLSYDPFGDGKTAIHAGYGLFWEHGTGYEANTGSLIGSAPKILSETQSNIGGFETGGISAYSTIGFSCQGGTTQCGSQTLPAGGATFPLNVTSLPKNTVYSYTQQWSLSVQREVSKNVVAQLAYVGTKGTHLTAVRDLNQIQPLAPGDNPFIAAGGLPLTASVCQGGALSNGIFPVTGINGAVNSGPTIGSSLAVYPGTAAETNATVACTGNPGFALSTGSPLGTTADSQRPFPGFSNIISVSNIADSKYNALQTTLRATTGPLTFGFAYTYGHSIDDASDRSSANFANSLDIHSNKASSDFDQRQLLNVSYLYDLPLLNLLHGFTHFVGGDLDDNSDMPTAQDSKTLQPIANDEAGPLLNTLLGGWQLSGITTFQTGSPFSVINAGSASGLGTNDNAGVGDGIGIGSFADIAGNPKGAKPTVAPGQNVGPLLLNPGAFKVPVGLTFGNSGRNYLNNPTRTNFNASLLKHFKPFGEGREIEFRAEAFNVFNHTQFRIYDPTHPGNTGNNVVNCYGDQSTGYSAGAPACLAGNSFLHPVDSHDPRILQFGLKASF
jgi:hypothetical protein